LTEPDRGSMPLRSEEDIVKCRQVVRKLTQQAKFSLVDQTKMITAASELSRNSLVYGRGGEMRWELIDQAGRVGLRLAFEDHGPGIANIEQAMADGFTTGKGLGRGLPGSKRLVNDFEIRSAPGEGTCVTVTRWK
jgi:serine/threonine-protein kinase RsbT